MFSRAFKLMLVGALVASSTLFVAAPASARPDQVIKVGKRDNWRPKHSYVRRGKDKKAVVVWKNPTRQRDHDIKALQVGTRWRIKRKMLRPRNRNRARKVFRKRGNYWYRCTFHSAKVNGQWQGMWGIVHVRR